MKGVRWMIEGNKKKKKGEERKERKKNGERERERWREKHKGRFSRCSDGLRRKVNPRIASYAWVLKSWSFVKLHKVENFPTWIIFSLKAI